MTTKVKTHKGTVKFFNESKGYGFIKDLDEEKEYFVHISGLLVKKLATDDEVNYELEETNRGLKAVNVQKV
jgi:CspA family cold shock protein